MFTMEAGETAYFEQTDIKTEPQETADLKDSLQEQIDCLADLKVELQDVNGYLCDIKTEPTTITTCLSYAIPERTRAIKGGPSLEGDAVRIINGHTSKYSSLYEGDDYYISGLVAEEEEAVGKAASNGEPPPTGMERQLYSYEYDGSYLCLLCGGRFSTKMFMRSHLKVKHADVKRHKCTRCDYQTDRTGDFNKHLVVHRDAKPFKCEKCGFRIYPTCKPPFAMTESRVSLAL